MKMSIKEFADLTNVSVRTLHYYDEIGLLKADYVDGHNGYRYYGEPALSCMQEILFYRELNFSLKDIMMILSSPDYNKQNALKKQKHLLVLKKERLEKIINMIERIEEGEKTMDFNAFDNSKFDKAMKKYKEEAQKRWGNTEAFQESEKRTAVNHSQVSRHKEAQFFRGAGYLVCSQYEASASFGVSILSVPCGLFVL